MIDTAAMPTVVPRLYQTRTYTDIHMYTDHRRAHTWARAHTGMHTHGHARRGHTDTRAWTHKQTQNAQAPCTLLSGARPPLRICC